MAESRSTGGRAPAAKKTAVRKSAASSSEAAGAPPGASEGVLEGAPAGTDAPAGSEAPVGGDGNVGEVGEVRPTPRTQLVGAGLPLISGEGTGLPGAADVTARTATQQLPVHAAEPDADIPEGFHIVPADEVTATTPPEGYGATSPNPVAASMALHSFAGEDHHQLVDEDGKQLDLDVAFSDPGGHATILTAVTDVFEQFWAVGQARDSRHGPMRRLLFPAGSLVPRGRYELLRSAQEQGQAQAGQRAD